MLLIATSNATSTDNVIHGASNAGAYWVPEMLDGITDAVINQVSSKTKKARGDDRSTARRL